jgi:hypothetical protein
MSETNRLKEVEIAPTQPGARGTLKVLPNPVLARLIEEVRNTTPDGPYAYNRQHNRHNR